MLKKTIFILFIGLIFIVSSFVIYKKYSEQSLEDLSLSNYREKIDAKKDLIRVTNIKAGDLLNNPFKIEGEARGNWYFEASFPIELVDSNGNILVLEPVQAKTGPDDNDGAGWMTTNFVPFSQEFYFKKEPTTKTGTLILRKDNPSGLPEHDNKIEIPIRFK